MITPKYLDNIIKGVENAVSENNEYLIKRIAKHVADSFAKGESNIIIPSTIKDMHKLMDSGMVLDDIQKEVIKLMPNLKKEIHSAFLQSANEIGKYETDFSKKLVQTLNNHGQKVDVEIPDYEAVGIPTSASQLHMTATEIRKLEHVYKGTLNNVRNYTKTMPSACNDLYISACNSAFMKAQSGVSPNTAICEAIEEMAEKGIRIVNYDSGHIDRVEVAVARAVRTGVNQANSQIVLTRCSELGVGYVKVSAHYGARVTKKDDYTNHSKWQGKIYALDYSKPELKNFNPTQEEAQDISNNYGWMNDVKTAVVADGANYSKYPDFVEKCGYGKLLGIAGVNCRHTFYSFYPDLQDDSEDIISQEENKRYYDLSQQQRAKEREIRELKRKVTALKASGLDDEDTQQRIAVLSNKLTDKNREYKQFCDANKLSMANWRRKI